MRRILLAAVVACAAAGTASAQTVTNVPIDTNALVVQPTAATTNILSSTTQYISRVVANTIDTNGIVRTFNNLLGRTTTTATTQAGYSPLPAPTTYPSVSYKNSFVPVMPTAQTFGQSVPAVR